MTTRNHPPISQKILSRNIFTELKGRGGISAAAWSVALLCAGLPLAKADLTAVQATMLPPPANRRIEFSRDIKPILETSCIKCHGRGRQSGGFSIETAETLLSSGDTGPDVVPGQSSTSYLIELVSGLNSDLVMPEKGTRLTPAQVGLLRAWIDQGVKWDKGITFARPPPNNLQTRRPDLPPGEPSANPIDRFLEPYFAAQRVKPVDPVDDRIFARRVYLDAVGLLPSPSALAAFVADPDPAKRDKLVAQLLADSPNYAQHWISFWNDLLRNEYGGAGARKEITAWLYRALATNLPYNKFVEELTDPTPETSGFVDGIVWRGTINASETPPMQAAQNISQVFLGVNLKCASCHDSFINDLTLADAYGMAAIYSDGPLELVRCDKPMGKKAALKFLYPELGRIDPQAEKGERIRQFVHIMTQRADGRLTRTIVNRLWERLLGRGLVETVDDMEKPSWNPDLLDWLAEDFADHGYDLRRLIGQILRSHAYQLPAVSVPERDEGAPFVFQGPWVRRITAEQFVDAIGELTGAWYGLPNAAIDYTIGTGNPPPEIPASLRRIWVESGTDLAAGALYFSRTVAVEAPAENPFLIVSATPAAAVRVNGSEIGKDRIRKFGAFDLVDLRGLVVAGRNRLALRIAATRRTRQPPRDVPYFLRRGRDESEPDPADLAPFVGKTVDPARTAQIPFLLVRRPPGALDLHDLFFPWSDRLAARRPPASPAGLVVFGRLQSAAPPSSTPVTVATDPNWTYATESGPGWSALDLPLPTAGVRRRRSATSLRVRPRGRSPFRWPWPPRPTSAGSARPWWDRPTSRRPWAARAGIRSTPPGLRSRPPFRPWSSATAGNSPTACSGAPIS